MSLLFNPPSGARINWGAPINRGLAGCWLLNEGGGQIFKDIVGVSNAAGIANPLNAPGKYGNALSFNGSSQYVSAPASSATYASAYSWSLWLSADNAPAAAVQPAIINGTGAGGNDGFSFTYGHGNGTFRFVAAVHTSTAYYAASFGTAPATKTWNHYVSTWDGSSLKSYLNGVLITTTATLGTYITTGSNIYIGGSPAAIYFPGRINNVRTYTRVLSLQEIMQLYVQPFAGVSTPRRSVWKIVDGAAFLLKMI